MMRFLGMAAFVTGLGLGPVSSQTLQLEGGSFNEVLRSSAEISGAVVAGFQVHQKVGGERGFRALLPPGLEETQICIRVTSANGLYDSENSYVLVGGSGTFPTPIDVDHPTQHVPFFEALAGEEVTASIALGDCNTRPVSLVLASWDSEVEKTAVLYLNSLRADRVVLRDEEREKTVQCRQVEAPLRSAYDTVCQIDLIGRKGPFDVKIVRFVNRSPAPPTELTLYPPAL